MNIIIIINYNPKDKIPPIKESYLDKYLILCYSQYIGGSTLSYAVRHDNRVCFSGISMYVASTYFGQLKVDDPNELPKIWSVHYNSISKNLLQLLTNKWNTQTRSKHICYIIKDRSDLNIIKFLYNLQGSRFLEVLENILRSD